ncbi:MAG: hypothetical protein JWP57_4407 [Spirosoma sp.]|nr:hypothetical protein [Spirosoma sp.]
MKRVVWVGRVARAALAVPCPTCNAELGAECELTPHRPAPHRARDEFAHTFGFRDVVEPGGLFNSKKDAT